jgi:hypothetical protein
MDVTKHTISDVTRKQKWRVGPWLYPFFNM